MVLGKYGAVPELGTYGESHWCSSGSQSALCWSTSSSSSTEGSEVSLAQEPLGGGGVSQPALSALNSPVGRVARKSAPALRILRTPTVLECFTQGLL